MIKPDRADKYTSTAADFDIRDADGNPVEGASETQMRALFGDDWRDRRPFEERDRERKEKEQAARQNLDFWTRTS